MDTAFHRPACSPQPELKLELALAAVSAAPGNGSRIDQWREAFVPHASAVTLRELQTRDAAPLSALLTTDAVTRFMRRPPGNAEGFARFIQWAQDEQAAGRQITFAIVAPGEETAAGIIQVRACDPNFTRAEWGFVLAERYWGTGLFMTSAEIVLRFLFAFVGLQRLEARSVALNVRGNGVLHKLGATPDGRRRRAFDKNGKYFDEVLWSLLAADWWQRRRHTSPQSH